jgi:hypothetical protein
MISPDKAILFGGAIGNTGKFSITGDTYLCDLKTMNWKKLERKTPSSFLLTFIKRLVLNQHHEQHMPQPRSKVCN